MEHTSQSYNIVERFEVSRQQEISDALHGKAKRGYINQVGEAEQPEPTQEEKPNPKAATLDDLYTMIAALGEGKGGGRGRPGKGEGKGDYDEPARPRMRRGLWITLHSKTTATECTDPSPTQAPTVRSG